LEEDARGFGRGKGANPLSESVSQLQNLTRRKEFPAYEKKTENVNPPSSSPPLQLRLQSSLEMGK